MVWLAPMLADCYRESALRFYSRRMAKFVPVVGRFRASKPPWPKYHLIGKINPPQNKSAFFGKVRAWVGFVASFGWIAWRRIHPKAAVWPSLFQQVGRFRVSKPPRPKYHLVGKINQPQNKSALFGRVRARMGCVTSIRWIAWRRIHPTAASALTIKAQ
jgi:hypothetical protein